MLRHIACRRCGSFAHRCFACKSSTSPTSNVRRILPQLHSGNTREKPGCKSRFMDSWSTQIVGQRQYSSITFWLKWISTNFPKRLLLLFRTVFAFPNASRRGLAENRYGKKQQLGSGSSPAALMRAEFVDKLPSTILSSISWPLPYVVVRYL